jgi:hypothetical protein
MGRALVNYKGFVAVPTKNIPIQAGNSLAYNPSEFFNVRNEKFKNASGEDIDKRLTALENMHKIGLGLLFVAGVILLLKNK